MPDTTWTLSNSTESISIDAVIDPSPAFPAVTPGSEQTWTLFFEGSGMASRHESVLAYATAARQGVVATGRTFDGEVFYHEHLPSASSLSTLVLKLAPNGSIGRDGRWVLVVGGQDASPSAGSIRRVELDLVDLGAASDYGNEGDVQTALYASTV